MVASRPFFLARTAMKKGITSLHSVVNQPQIFSAQTFTCKAFEKGNKWRFMKGFTQGWKPFACSKCDKSFTDNSDLRKHYITYTEERPFACSKYDIILTQYQLKKNMKEPTQERSHSPVPNVTEEFAQIVSSLLGHRSAVDGVNIEFLWIGAVSACDWCWNGSGWCQRWNEANYHFKLPLTPLLQCSLHLLFSKIKSG